MTAWSAPGDLRPSRLSSGIGTQHTSTSLHEHAQIPVVPIDVEEFESVEDVEERSTSERIVELLLENRDAAFTRGEIASAIDRDPNTVGTNLSRLKERGLVRHRGNHWAITDDRQLLVRELRFSEALSRLDDAFGSVVSSEADAEAWADAQPDRPHSSEESTEDDGTQLELDAVEETDN